MHISPTTEWIQSNSFCNDVHLLQKHQNTKNHVIWCSGWSGVDIWLWKVGFTPQPIRHGLPDVHLSSSSAVKSCQAGLPSNAKLNGADRGCGWEAAGQNVALHLPLLSALLNGRASHAQIHTGCAGQFYKSAGISSSEFGAGSGKQHALLQHHIPFFQDCLPLTAPISNPRAHSEPISYPMVCSGRETVW